MPGETWIDLLDPSREQLETHLPAGLHESDLGQLRAPGAAGRPRLAAHRDHIVGVLLVAVAVPAEDDVFYQEIDVVLTRDRLLTVRKSTPGRTPYEPEETRTSGHPGDSPAVCFYRLAADVAERYLDLVDDLEVEIGELEDHVEEWDPERVRERLRRLRHQILHVRRTLAPMRDAFRAVADGRIDLEGDELFTRDLEHEFAGVHDTLMRAADGLELAHDLLATTRDYLQAKIASDQNEAAKRLTVIATVLLLPTVIVGIYGQNFEHVPELGWGFGYYYSLGVIAAAMLGALAFFKWRRYF